MFSLQAFIVTFMFCLLLVATGIGVVAATAHQWWAVRVIGLFVAIVALASIAGLVVGIIQ